MKTGKARFEDAIRPDGMKMPGDDADVRERMEMDLITGGNAFTPDGKTFVLGAVGNFHLFDTASGKQRAKLPSEQRFHTEVAISANARNILTSADGANQSNTHPLALWDLSSGKQLWRTTLPGFPAGSIVFSPDGRMFASSVDEPKRQILVYELASGKVRHTISDIPGTVRSLAFFPDDRRLASGLTDTTILIWDLSAAESAN